nr:glycosyltransferase family 2 protein [uncultured Rhodopila sp.]
MAYAPRFSIVVPISDASVHRLERLAASLAEQWYPHWQLIVGGPDSAETTVRGALAGFRDARMQICCQQEDRGAAAATNAAIEQAQGDFVVFAEPCDELTADCLYELTLAVIRQDPDFIYSDEDSIGFDGQLTDPFFKPDWSPDTFMSLMFARHVMCVRRILLDSVGMLHPDFEGGQDYDLALRIVEQTNRIAHIPKILYHAHRRGPGAPPTSDASRRARVAALARRGIAGSVEPVPGAAGYFRVCYEMRGTPLISIIIPTKDNAALLRHCIDSIVSLSSYRNVEIIVIDNGSSDPEAIETLRQLANQDRVTVINHDRPFNYSAINNAGANYARGDLLLFLNDDTEVLTPDWLERMAGYAQLEHVGAAGAKLLYPGTRTIQHAGVLNLAGGPSQALAHRNADDPGYFMRGLLEYNWIAVTGACLMIERRKFDAVGGFNECLPIAYNDVDLCFKLIGSGFYNVTCSAVELVHHESMSRGSDHLSPEKLARLAAERKYLYKRHPHFNKRDPFYSHKLGPDGAVRVQ